MSEAQKLRVHQRENQAAEGRLDARAVSAAFGASTEAFKQDSRSGNRSEEHVAHSITPSSSFGSAALRRNPRAIEPGGTTRAGHYRELVDRYTVTRRAQKTESIRGFAVVFRGGYACVGAAVILGWLRTRAAVRLTRDDDSAQRASCRHAAPLIMILLRPVVMVPPAAAKNSLLPILVDVSRSMRLRDADGPSRLERAQAMVKDLQAQLGKEYRLELLTFGETLAATTDIDRVAATARRSDWRRADLRSLSPSLDGPGELRRDRPMRRSSVRLRDPASVNPVMASNRAPVSRSASERGAARDREIVTSPLGALLPGARSMCVYRYECRLRPTVGWRRANGPGGMRRSHVSEGAPVLSLHRLTACLPTVLRGQIPQRRRVAPSKQPRVLVPPQTVKRRCWSSRRAGGGGGGGYEHTFLKRAFRTIRDSIDAVSACRPMTAAHFLRAIGAVAHVALSTATRSSVRNYSRTTASSLAHRIGFFTREISSDERLHPRARRLLVIARHRSLARLSHRARQAIPSID